MELDNNVSAIVYARYLILTKRCNTNFPYKLRSRKYIRDPNWIQHSYYVFSPSYLEQISNIEDVTTAYEYGRDSNHCENRRNTTEFDDTFEEEHISYSQRFSGYYFQVCVSLFR